MSLNENPQVKFLKNTSLFDLLADEISKVLEISPKTSNEIEELLIKKQSPIINFLRLLLMNSSGGYKEITSHIGSVCASMPNVIISNNKNVKAITFSIKN